MAVTMKRTVFWVVTTCSLERAQYFGGAILLPAGFLLGLLSSPEFGGLMPLQNVGLSPIYVHYSPEDYTLQFNFCL
jgi:hypothetical protein